MKKTLFVLAATLLAPTFAHAACEDTMQTWADKLHPGRTLDASHSACKPWPANPELTLAALTLPHADNEGNEGTYDLDVLVADSASGSIVAHAYQPDAIESDGIAFADIALDTARYQLTPTNRAFGVRIGHEGASVANPYARTSLSLYVVDGQTLRLVLDRLTVEQASGEWDTRCKGFYDTTTRSVSLGAPGRDGYASLKLNGKTVHSVSRWVKDDCVGKDGPPKRESATLDYRDGRYAVPKSMRQQGSS